MRGAECRHAFVKITLVVQWAATTSCHTITEGTKHGSMRPTHSFSFLCDCWFYHSFFFMCLLLFVHPTYIIFFKQYICKVCDCVCLYVLCTSSYIYIYKCTGR